MKSPRPDLVVAAGTAVLLLACFVVFWPAIRGEFLWDDILNIVSNPVIQRDSGLLDIWLCRRDVFDYYPLTWTTWWVEWHTWRRATPGYHVLNILLHAGAACMLWRALLRLRLSGAFVAALVFAVHPVSVETVAWISERKNTLSMFLLSVTLVLHLDAETAEERRRRRGLYWASVVTFALALLAKPSVVLLPACLLALAWWRTGRITRRDVLRSIPFFVISAAVSIITVLVHHARSIITAEVRTDGFASRLVGAGRAVWFYLSKLVWPAELSFIYPRWNLDARSLAQWLPLVALVGLAGLLFTLRNRIGRGPLAALACYVALLMPILGFIDVYFMRYSLVSDHWQYPAEIAAIAALVGTATTLLRRLPPSIFAAVSVALSTCVCLALGGLTWREAHVYRTNATLWADVIKHHPSSAIAHNNYGAELWAMGRRDEARAHYRRSIELDPRSWEGYVSMGLSYIQEGSLDDAIDWFRQALGRHGSGKDPRIRLADALLVQGDNTQALDYYEQALAADPTSPVDRAIVGTLLEQHGRVAPAMKLYREQAQSFPDDPEGWFRLADALLRHGQSNEAGAAFAQARRASAGNHVTLTSLGSRMIVAGHPELAVDALKDAVRARPDYGPAHNHLGRAFEALGQLDEAARAYAEAIRVQPGFQEAADNLARVRRPTSAPATRSSP